MDRPGFETGKGGFKNDRRSRGFADGSTADRPTLEIDPPVGTGEIFRGRESNFNCGLLEFWDDKEVREDLPGVGVHAQPRIFRLKSGKSTLNDKKKELKFQGSLPIIKTGTVDP
jgi:hypothetical protein